MIMEAQPPGVTSRLGEQDTSGVASTTMSRPLQQKRDAREDRGRQTMAGLLLGTVLRDLSKSRQRKRGSTPCAKVGIIRKQAIGFQQCRRT